MKEIGRAIAIYDNKTEIFIEFVDIDYFDLSLFKSRFKTKDEDPLMYDPYLIDDSTKDLFQNYDFDFLNKLYFIEAYQRKDNNI